MKAKVAVLFLAMTALAAALPARSQDSMTMTTPVFGQIVSYQLPAFSRATKRPAPRAIFRKPYRPARPSMTGRR